MCIALTGLLFVFLCSAVTDNALLLSAPQYQAQCKHRRHPPDSPPPPQPRRVDRVAEYSDVCRLCMRMYIAQTGLLFVFLCSAVTDHALLLSAASHLTRRLP